MCRMLEITVSRDPAAICIAAHEDPQRNSAWRPDITAAIAGEAGAPMTARTIQAHVVRRIAAAAGGHIVLEGEPHVLRTRFTATQ